CRSFRGDADRRQPTRRREHIHATASHRGRSRDVGLMSKKILIIEDEPGLRLTLSDRLRSEGYEVDTAPDGPQGEAKAITGAFDLILLDVMLPGKGGFDVCRDVRQQGTGTPILMLTARGQTIDKVL